MTFEIGIAQKAVFGKSGLCRKSSFNFEPVTKRLWPFKCATSWAVYRLGFTNVPLVIHGA